MKATFISLSFLLMFLFSATSCRTAEDYPPLPEMTLTKSQLYDKEWYRRSVHTPDHTFHSDGKYNLNGSWEWINDTDSMQVVSDSGASPYIIYFYWSTSSEMVLDYPGSYDPDPGGPWGGVLSYSFKDHPWSL